MERGVVSPGLALLGTACRTCRTFRTTRRVVATSSRRHGSSTAAAEALAAGVDGLPRRPAKFIPDYLVPMPSHLLTTTLSDLLTPSSAPPSPPPSSSSPIIQHPPPPLPQGHHLVYFPIQTPPSRLAADGADPDHGPGGPFARRMWAGGEVVFSPRWRERLLLDGRAWACEERVERVDVKGVAGAEKVFVDVWRRYGLGHEGGAREWDIEERRTLVFMRNEEEGAGTQAAAAPRRPIKFPHPASYSISLTPTPTHLFHFSALTFNAHAIHLDTGYARGTDGHRGLLVHGPLTLALMLRALAEQSASDGSGDNSSPLNSSGGSRSGGGSAPVGKVRRIAYRNYAPLYVDERMTVCVRRPADAAGSWDVWVEGPDGGLAVKGTAEMERE